MPSDSGQPEAVIRAYSTVIEYDGTDFQGWQVQPGERTVQGVLEAALGRLLGHPVALNGSGRTDAGVHALGQVASFYTSSRHGAERIRHSLNGMLPKDVSIRQVDPAPLDFHARKDATGKHYCYSILNRRSPSGLLHRTSWHMPFHLDHGAMAAAMELLIGEHDFAAFCSSNATTSTTIRELTRVQLAQGEGDLLKMHFEGKGFLKYMVRSLAGTLVQIGRGRRPVDFMKMLLEPGPRSLAGPTAPPQGLVLVEVFYD